MTKAPILGRLAQPFSVWMLAAGGGAALTVLTLLLFYLGGGLTWIAPPVIIATIRNAVAPVWIRSRGWRVRNDRPRPRKYNASSKLVLPEALGPRIRFRPGPQARLIRRRLRNPAMSSAVTRIPVSAL